MRVAALIPFALVICLGAVSWLARGAEPCPWRDPGKAPRVFLDGAVATFRTYYDGDWAACAAPRGADLQIEWRLAASPGAEPLEVEKARVFKQSRRHGPARIESKIVKNQVCDKLTLDARAPRTLSGLPGEERVSQLVQIRASVAATGPLGPLSHQSSVLEFPCPACRATSGRSLRVHESRGEQPRIEGRIDAAWFECARHGATLTLLGFAGKSDSDVRVATRPHLKLDGLEKKFVRRGDRYELDEPLPLTRLCAKGLAVWSFEFWGRGELARSSGGGRSVHHLRCRP